MLNRRIEGDRRDFGPEPLVVNIDAAARANPYYRRTLWTGKHLQVTLMHIPAGGDIGLEMHPDFDQFIRIESGYGLVRMGKDKDKPDIEQKVNADYAVIIPAGTWHNMINIGSRPLTLYSVYAPPAHPFGTVHETKEMAEEAEAHHH